MDLCGLSEVLMVCHWLSSELTFEESREEAQVLHYLTWEATCVYISYISLLL